MLRSPRIVVGGPALCSGEVGIEIRPPPYVIPDIITLNTVQEDAEVPIFVVQTQVDTVAEFRIRVSKERPVISGNQTITVYVCIFKPTNSDLILIDGTCISGLRTGSSIRRIDFSLIIPESVNFVAKELADRMPYRVPNVRTRC